MALPQQINKAVPPGSEAIALGDNRIREFKQAICEILGIPDATNITNPLFAVLAAGLASVYFANKAANPTVDGELARNGTSLLFKPPGIAAVDLNPNNRVLRAGDTMTGALTLFGNAVAALHAVPKQQLDAAITALGATAFTYKGGSKFDSGGVLISSGSFGSVGLSNSDFDSGGYNAATWINIPVGATAGVYLVTAFCDYAVSAAGTFRGIGFIINDVTPHEVLWPPAPAISTHTHMSRFVVLNPGDTIKLRLGQNSGGVLGIGLRRLQVVKYGQA